MMSRFFHPFPHLLRIGQEGVAECAVNSRAVSSPVARLGICLLASNVIFLFMPALAIRWTAFYGTERRTAPTSIMRAAFRAMCVFCMDTNETP